MLKGQNVNLRTVRSRDLESYLELSSDIASKGAFYPVNLPTETSLKARFDKDGMWSEESGSLLIVDPISDRIMGLIVHFKPTHYYQAVELGYIMFDTESRGKGLMTEAVQLMVKYMFALKPIFRIQIQLESGNIGSRRVAEKSGFTHEGTARQAIIANGRPTDLEVFSMTRREWESMSHLEATL